MTTDGKQTAADLAGFKASGHLPTAAERAGFAGFPPEHLPPELRELEHPDAYDVVERHWPYDGPYSDETTRAAALMIQRLGRYLNNATGKRDALPWAATGGAVIGELSATVYGLQQLLEQLAGFFTAQADDPTLYEDRYQRPPGDVARELAATLAEAVPAAHALFEVLDRANSLGSRLGNREPVDATDPR